MGDNSTAGGQCKYGVGAPLIYLTVPYDFNFLEWASIFWSSIPFVMNALYLTAFVLTRRQMNLAIAACGLLASAFNSFAIQTYVEEPRPPKSCLHGEALPSGHSLTAMAFFTFIFIEFLQRPLVYTGLRRKIFYILTAAVLFLPAGPFRIPINDHTWKQVGVGMGAGVLWGAFFWLLVRFIFSRFLNEYLMSAKWANYILINDYDPNFLYSQWKGKKYEERTKGKKVVPPTPKYHWDKKKILALHLLFAIVTFLLGCSGIALGFVKDHLNPKCERSAPGLLISVGCYNILLGLLFIFLLILGKYRFDQKKIIPDFITKIVLSCIGFFIWTSIFFAIAGVYASVDDASCKDPNSTSDSAVVYFIVFFSITGFYLLVWAIFYIIWHLRRFYGSRKEDPTTQSKSKDIENPKSKEEDKNLPKLPKD